MSAPEAHPPVGNRVTILTDMARKCSDQSANAAYEPAARALAQASVLFALLAADLDAAGQTGSWSAIVGPHPDPAWRGLHADDVAEMIGLDRDAPLDLLCSELRSVNRLREIATSARSTIDELAAVRNEVAGLVGMTHPDIPNEKIVNSLRWRLELLTARVREERERSESRRVLLVSLVAAVDPVIVNWHEEDDPIRGIGTGLYDALDELARVHAAAPNDDDPQLKPSRWTRPEDVPEDMTHQTITDEEVIDHGGDAADPLASG